MRNNLNVTFNLDRLHCYDEGDGWGNAEPYLWTIFFKIDGETCRLGNSLMLEGTATLFTTPGSHGNLNNTDVDAGDDVAIPSSIGEQTMNLIPIPVPQFVKDLGRDDISAVAGCIVVLMEEDNVSDDGANSGHAALNAAVQDALNSIIPTLGFGNEEVTDEAVSALMETVQSRIESAIKNQQNVFENIWSWLNADDLVGTKVWRFSGDQLLSDTPINLQQRWKKEGDWEIFGSVSALEIPSCPATLFDDLFGNAGANGASSSAIKSMYAFREKEMIRHQGLTAWWKLATDNSHYLQQAMADKEMAAQAKALFAGIPEILKHRDKPIDKAHVKQLNSLFAHMKKLAANDRKGRKDIGRAMDALKYASGKTTAEVIEVLSSVRPSRYPALPDKVKKPLR